MQRKRKPLTQLSLEDQVACEKRQKNFNNALVPSVEESPTQARAGTVSRMVLKNFMCHSHLEVELSCNINYVIGQNGSGKSAILTALVVGLGGKAALTKRGSSIKGFIKAGKNNSTIEITLRNSGPLAYRHNLYGDEITIIRHILPSGTGSYKVKAASGEIVSTKAKEVQHICNGLNIQVDNPICLLNQDTSRNFLNTKDPRQKFILFMRATRLEMLYEEYKKIFNNKKNAIQALKDKEVLYNNLKQQLQELRRKAENHKSLVTLTNKVKLLQCEVLWAKVRDAEQDVQKQEEVVNRLNEDVSGIEHQLLESAPQQSEREQIMRNLQQQIEELKESIDNQIAPQNALVYELGGLKESANEKQREKRVLLKDIALKTGNCGILEQEITKIMQNFSQLEQEKMARLQEMANLEEKLKGIHDLLDTSKNDQYQIRSSLSRLQEEEHNLQTEIRQINMQIESTTSRLNSLQENSKLTLYGMEVPRIIDAINAVKDKFTHLPRGPLGSYIKLKDKKWGIAVEGFLTSGLLRAFTVDNRKDNELLLKIFQRVCGNASKPMIITSKFIFQVHDVTTNLVESVDDCVSVFSVLEISDPIVANCLIDQTSLESVLLITDNKKAIHLMSDKRLVPRNCRQGITMNGDRYYPDPNYKTYASNYHSLQFLQVSAADMSRQLKQQISNLGDKKHSIANQHKSINTELQEQLQKMKEIEVKITKLNRAQLHVRRQYDDLQNVNEPDVANVKSLENELTQLKQVIQQQKVVSQKIEDHLKEVKANITEKEEQLERIKHVVRGYEDRIGPLKQQIVDHKTKIKELATNKQFIKKRLDECNKRVADAKAILANKQTVMGRYQQEASSIGQRPDSLREVQAIVEELNTNQRTIKQIESDMESAEVVLEKYEECNQKYKEVTDLMKNMCEDVKELQLAAEKRNRYYKHTEDYFVTFVKHSFQKVLEFRQFKGSLEINMKEHTLDLVVIPQQGSQGICTTANLSGGERSFSTVAFLYALWQCMEFPFYFLDEFDVFMDKVNRTKVMEILLYHAKSCPDLQFVFLTPQDISFVTDKAVAIHRLEDPKRSHTQS